VSQGILASFEYLDSAVEGIEGLREAGFKGQEITVYAPYPEHRLEHALGYKESPVRVFALVGAVTGAATGFGFPAFTSMDWPLVTGGKPILSMPAYVIIAFELAVLFGVLATVIGLFINSRLPALKPPLVYDPEFSSGTFGVYVEAEGDRLAEARKILDAQGPEELLEAKGRGHA
jgi:ActD protein